MTYNNFCLQIGFSIADIYNFSHLTMWLSWVAIVTSWYAWSFCCSGSPGGSVTAGLGIYDTMQYILPPIATWCVGQACSMASLLLAAGAPGMRHALPNARIMIHQPSGGVQVISCRLLAVSDQIGHFNKFLSFLKAHFLTK